MCVSFFSFHSTSHSNSRFFSVCASFVRSVDAELCELGHIEQTVWRRCSQSKPIDQITLAGKSDKRKIRKCVSIRISGRLITHSLSHSPHTLSEYRKLDERAWASWWRCGHIALKHGSSQWQWNRITDIKNTSRTIRYIVFMEMAFSMVRRGIGQNLTQFSSSEWSHFHAKYMRYSFAVCRFECFAEWNRLRPRITTNFALRVERRF